jgi:hypothetical protein
MIGNEVVQWMEENLPQFENSTWKPALYFQRISLLESLKSPIYTGLLQLLRSQPGTTESPIAARQSSLFKRLGTQLQSKRWRRLGEQLVQQQLIKSRSESPLATPVVFWPREPTHIRAQLPVAQVLTSRNQSYQFLACNANIAHQLQSAGQKVVYAATSWQPHIINAIEQVQKQLAIFKQAPEISLTPLSPEVTTNQLIALLRSHLITYSKLVAKTWAIAHAMNEMMKPAVVLVGNDITPEGRTVALFAAQHKVSTVCLMHGAAVDPLQKFHIVDKMLVYGPATYRQFLSEGISPERLIITGATYLDAPPEPSKLMHADIRQHFRLFEKKPYVLVATSGPGNTISHKHHILIIESLVYLARSIPEITIIIKLHRKDKLDYYAEVYNRMGTTLPIALYQQRGLPDDIFDWLKGCSLLLTTASTVAIEAMLMEVPVITMDFCDELRQVDFINAQTTRHVRTTEELVKGVLNVLETSPETNCERARVDTYLHEMFYYRDGLAAHRSADIIQGMSN